MNTSLRVYTFIPLGQFEHIPTFNAAVSMDRNSCLAGARQPFHLMCATALAILPKSKQMVKIRTYRHNLVIHSTQRHAKRSPRIDMVLNRYCPTSALALADGEVLLEGGGALNGGLVHLRVFVDVI